ncbi:MAG: hypothetical protein Q9182_005516 [Xanthomendoza sp. 2 TL-2023]
MDVQLRVLLARPTPKAILSEFLKYIQAAKPNWFDLYKPYTRQQTSSYGKPWQRKFQRSSSSPENSWTSNVSSGQRQQDYKNPIAYRPPVDKTDRTIKQERYETTVSKFQRVPDKLPYSYDKPKQLDKSKQSDEPRYKGKGKQAYYVDDQGSDDENRDPEAEHSDASQGYDPEYYHGTPYDDNVDDEQPEVQDSVLDSATCTQARSKSTNHWSSRATTGSNTTAGKTADHTEKTAVDRALPSIVHSTAPPATHEPGYSYRGYQYAKVMACIGSPANDLQTSCQDSGCAHFRRELHVVDNLDANVLLGSDILYPEGWVLDYPGEQAVLSKNLGLRIQLQVVNRDEKRVKRTVYSKDKVIIPAHHRAMIPVGGLKGKPLDLPAMDMMFEPSNQAVTLFASLVNGDTSQIMAQNSTDYPVTIAQHTKLGSFDSNEVGGYFTTAAENEPLAGHGKNNGWKRAMIKCLLAATAACKLANKPSCEPAGVTEPATTAAFVGDIVHAQQPTRTHDNHLPNVLREREVSGAARKREAGKTRVLQPTTSELDAYRTLQKLFTRPEILTHFDASRILYNDIDSSQEAGHGAYAYHVKDMEPTMVTQPPRQKTIQPILLPIVMEARKHLDTLGEVDHAYPVAVAEMSREFRNKVRQAYQNDRQCARILDILEDNNNLQDNAARLPFIEHRRLIYFDDHEIGRRLVIPATLDKGIFQTAHDLTGHPATQILYGQRIKEGLDLARAEPNMPVTQLEDEAPPDRRADRRGSAPPMVATNNATTAAYPVIAYPPPYLPTHIDAKDAIALAAMTMKRQYDRTRIPKFFQVGDWVSSSSLVPSMSRLHPVISIAHLEPAHPPANDPYERQPTAEPILTTDGLVNRQPERLLRRRDQRRRGGGVFTQYLVRYQGLGVEFDESKIDRSLPADMRAQFDAAQAVQRAGQPTIQQTDQQTFAMTLLPTAICTKLVRYLLLKWTPDAIAAELNVGRSTVYELEGNIYRYGSSKRPPRAAKGRSSKLTVAARKALFSFIAANPTASQQEMGWMLWEEFAIMVHQSTISRAVAAGRRSRKIAQRISDRQSNEFRMDWRAQCMEYTADQFVFLDETLVNEATGWRHYAYAPVGQPARYRASRSQGTS